MQPFILRFHSGLQIMWTEPFTVSWTMTMEQVESLLSVITFILKSLKHGQVDDMDIELLRSFSLSHLAIAEDLKSSNVNEVSPVKSECETDKISNALENKTENQDIETMDVNQRDNDQMNICGGPVDTDLNIQASKEINQEEPKDPLNEITKEGLQSHKVKRKRREKEIQINVIVFRCLFCDLDFQEEEEFHNHDSEKHLKDGKFHCVCNEAFSDKRDAVNHFMFDHNKMDAYPCSECTESFFGKKELTEHLKDVHNKLVSSRQCPICLDGVTYGHHDSKNSLRKHMYNEHKNVQFKCDICDNIFKSKEGFINHKKLLHSGERIKYTCEECSQDYYNKNSYENHVAKHNGEPSYCCDKCNKKFYTAFKLQSHGYEHKNENRRFYCTQCEYSSKTRVALRRHMSTLHSDDRPFKCNLCNSTFKAKITLAQHERIHTGEKPFKCKYCEKSFRQRKHQTRHEDIHEQNYKHSCMICDRKFIQTGNFKLHMSKHHPTAV